MIFDAYGNVWGEPKTIGFHRQPQRELDDDSTITGITPSGSLPQWAESERSDMPVAARRRERR